VAIPLQAKPSPAPIMVTEATLCPLASSRYGAMVATPSPTSTSVRVRSLECDMPRSGAHSAIPTTPATIVSMAMCSFRPARSPSRRWAKNTSTIRPAASVGCTTTSGASSSATTWSGQPSIDIPVPSSQRALRTSLSASAGRRCWSSGATRASVAWKATPRLYSVEAAIAARIPNASSTMSTDDHRSLGVLTSVVLATYWAPALSGILPALRRPLGVEDRTSSGSGYALTFDDGPDARGTPAVLDVLARTGARATFFLVGEQVQRNPVLVGEILAGGHTVGIHCQRHRNLLRLAPRQVREDLRTARAVIEDLAGERLALYRPPYGILNATALRIARANGWRTFLWSHWGRDWEGRATPASIASLLTRGATPGSVGLLHDSDRYGAAESWRRTAAALPAVLDALAARGLEPSTL
jgi:peptidoglycan-N-acetylglucosamine deacetylase